MNLNVHRLSVQVQRSRNQIASSNPCSETNVELLPPSNVALFSPNTSHSYDISVNPSRLPLSSSLSTPLPTPLFSRPSNISENPEWSPLWLATPPLRKMIPLPTYQVPATINFGANIDDARAINDPEIAYFSGSSMTQKRNSLTSQPCNLCTTRKLTQLICHSFLPHVRSRQPLKSPTIQSYPLFVLESLSCHVLFRLLAI